MLSKVLTPLFFLGVFVALLLCVWILSLFVFVFDTTIEDPGLIAEVPKRIFLLAPLVLLGFVPQVQETLRKLGFHD